MAFLTPRERRSGLVCRFSCTLLLEVLLIPGARGQAVDEYQVKAAFLYNFAKFVKWPPQSFQTLADPIVICILGPNPFGGALEEAVQGKVVEGRKLLVLQISDGKQAASCQILFISSSERKRSRSILADLKSIGILTVGETEGFAGYGGVVNFRLDGNRVRLEVNIDAAEQQKLRISSKLLSLAQIVGRK
jgi:hypothetical protein